MAGFSHRRLAKHGGVRCLLGPLEREVMEVLWRVGECSVREVLRQMERPAAYTTVMTTLVRLLGKGVLKQSKQERAFRYAPLFTAQEMEVRIATDLINRFLSGPRAQRAARGSSRLMAIAELDESLLEELEKAIWRKRIELAGGKAAGRPRRESQELEPLGGA
jgi:predicted transcriptional regulator